MWLVLCTSNDVAALWAYQGLKAGGLAPLELVRAEVLAYSVHWEHRLGADGVHVAITLADGRRIRSDTLRGVLNRLSWAPPEHLVMAHPGDRDYATQELTAFYLSWLYALPGPVLNQPTPQGLSGQWRHVSEWVWLASKAGLPTPEYRQSSHDYLDEMGVERRLVPTSTPVNTVLVVAEHVVGAPAPPDILKGCQRLAELSRTELLGVEFAAGSAGPWTFTGATPWPDLRLGGQALLDVLASVLRGEVEKNE
jgi:hypothetical protein